MSAVLWSNTGTWISPPEITCDTNVTKFCISCFLLRHWPRVQRCSARAFSPLLEKSQIFTVYVNSNIKWHILITENNMLRFEKVVFLHVPTIYSRCPLGWRRRCGDGWHWIMTLVDYDRYDQSSTRLTGFLLITKFCRTTYNTWSHGPRILTTSPSWIFHYLHIVNFIHQHHRNPTILAP